MSVVVLPVNTTVTNCLTEMVKTATYTLAGSKNS